jgi:hypothetical protein
MAVMNLKSLVLRGSAVLSVGKAGNMRRGSGSTAYTETPEIGISMRLPSHSGKQEFSPAWRHADADYCRIDARAAFGAGRSLRCASVLSRSRLRWTSSTLTRLLTAVFPAVPTVVERWLAGLAWCKPVQTLQSASA